MRKKVDPFVRANSASASSDCLALTELTRLGEQKCLYGVKFARLGGRAYQHRKVTRLGAVSYYSSQLCKRFATFYKEKYEELARPF